MTVRVYDYPRDWYRATESLFALRSRSQVSERTWAGGKNVYGPHAQLWVMKMTLATQEENVLGQKMRAFFSRLGGQAGYIRIGDPFRRHPLYNRVRVASSQAWSDETLFGDGTGWQSGLLAPTVTVESAASAGADYVVLKGLPASTAAALERGDLIEFRPNGAPDNVPRLHEVMHAAPTNASGEAGFEIRPRLRAGIAAGDMAVLEDPMTIFHCIDDEQGAFEVRIPGHGIPAFTLVEALDLIP